MLCCFKNRFNLSAWARAHCFLSCMDQFLYRLAPMSKVHALPVSTPNPEGLSGDQDSSLAYQKSLSLGRTGYPARAASRKNALTTV